MADRIPGPCNSNLRDSVCIDVNRVYDCCKDRDCITDMRLYIPDNCQSLVDRAINVKPDSAELIWAYIDVEELAFNKGFYTVDVKFFFKCSVDVFTGVGRPQKVTGLCTFDKRVILYGSEGGAKIYSSEFVADGHDTELAPKTNLPKCTVETIDPMMLAVKLAEPCDRCGCCEVDLASLPSCICSAFFGNLIDAQNGKRIYVTLGLFSIIRLMRQVQLLVPSYDFCIPEKECENTEDDPCNFFYKMNFPLDQFFPPRLSDVSDEPECGEPRQRSC